MNNIKTELTKKEAHKTINKHIGERSCVFKITEENGNITDNKPIIINRETRGKYDD